MESSPLLTKKDLANLLQVSVRTITRWQSASEIPKPIKVGGSLRWRRDEVISWLTLGRPLN